MDQKLKQVFTKLTVPALPAPKSTALSVSRFCRTVSCVPRRTIPANIIVLFTILFSRKYVSFMTVHEFFKRQNNN
ncbi:hypothetical protein BpHYR1_020937 [Brachionus plicatilis]|uniref:Uncharacterized protein n=1 Tax=Brachionus plicatilis TaxID=10195 RepID=A0A3M7RQJ0_BRAPC|nr:hypothetical protein BpHYR1_020937 [Brachionus plicatilis]